MNQGFLLWLRRCQLTLMLLLSAAPPVLMSVSQHAPDMLPAVYSLFAACALLCSLCLAASGRRRLLAAGLSAALLLLLGSAMLPLKARPLLLALPLSMIALLLLSLPFAARQHESEIPPAFYVTGIGIHAVVQFLVHYFGRSGDSPYDPIAPALTWICLSYLLLLLLSMNRISLDNASLARHRVPPSIRRFNTVLTLAFMALSLLLALTPAVIRGVRALWATLLAVLARINAFLLSLLPSGEDYGSAAPGMQGFGLPQVPAAETSALAQLMEKVFSVVAAVIVVAGCLFLLRLLFILLRRLVRHLFAQLRRYVAAASSDYDDEITDTREDGAERSLNLLRRARPRAKAQDRTPVGRIRQTYARLLRRHPKWVSSSTARENLPSDAAALYERARYSDHPVTEDEAERFAAGAKKL